MRTESEWSATVYIMCVCTKPLLSWYTLQACWKEKTQEKNFFSSLALIPGHNALIPKNLLQWVEKKESAGIPHWSPCVLNFLRLRHSLLIFHVWWAMWKHKRRGEKECFCLNRSGLLKRRINVAYGKVSTVSVCWLLLMLQTFHTDVARNRKSIGALSFLRKMVLIQRCVCFFGTCWRSKTNTLVTINPHIFVVSWQHAWQQKLNCSTHQKQKTSVYHRGGQMTHQTPSSCLWLAGSRDPSRCHWLPGPRPRIPSTLPDPRW